MVKRTNADGSATVYIGGIFEKNFNASGIATGTTKYYSALGRTLAVRTETSGGAGTLSYLLADHLGSTVAALNSSGGVVANSTTKYWPYGAIRSGGTASPQPTDQMYTGQQQELGDALGLYNYKARMYSTVTGRFLSVDPVAGAVGDPQSWNPYSYVRNNPLTHTDPTGMCDPDNPGCPFFKPAPWEDATGDSQLTLGTAHFLNAPFCWDCYRLERLAASGASVQHLIAAAHSSNAEDYLRQVYEYRGHSGPPGPVDAAIDFVPYVGDGRALADFRLTPGYVLTVALVLSPIPGDRLAVRPFANSARLTKHFTDHGAKLGAKNEAEYLLRANRLVERGLSNDSSVELLIRSDGDRLIWDTATREFAIVRNDGVLRTYLTPDTPGNQYWEKQIRDIENGR